MRAFGILVALAVLAFIGVQLLPDQTATSADGIVSSGDRVVLASEYFGCADKQDVEKIDRLVSQDDANAAVTLGYERCAILKPKIPMVVMERELLKNIACVRPVGKPHCMWTRLTLLKQEK
jgi:hypothetical protein